MVESPLELYREYIMSRQERDTIEAKIQNWLIEEGYEVSKKDNPKTYFTIAAKHGTGMHIGVSQSLESKDKVTVEGGVEITNPKFRELPEKERLDFLWELRYDLITNNIIFAMIPNGQLPNKILLLKNIWYDGLTKDNFMNTAQKIVEGKLMTLWKFQQKLGAPEPKSDQMVV
jgi:hypothetical protein